MAISKQTRIAKTYRFNMDAGNAQLGLALAYSEDGAPDSAVRCAEMAIQFLKKAIALKASIFWPSKTLDSKPEKS